VRLALCSGSDIALGYFNAYALIARRADLDAVLHLGDYLYEYADGSFGDGVRLGRKPQPGREIVRLADYRTRHAQYKSDPDLQELHRQHPFISIWNDHEIAEGAWRGGARNHQPDEGPWAARWQNALRAYLEWMPIREVAMDRPARAYRRFRFGSLVELMMLETRLQRDRALSDPGDRSALRDPARSMLGAQQEEWLLDLLSRSKAAGIAWRLVGQQTLFGQLRGEQGGIRSADAWDGYPISRERILDHLEQGGIDDTVVVGGDLHGSWALDLSRDPFSPEVYDSASGRGSLAVEFLTPGVTAPALRDSGEAARAAARTLERNPHVKWVDLSARGYALLDIDRERVQCEWYHLDSVTEPRPGEHLARAFLTRRGRNHLEPAPRASRPRRSPPPLAP
jgi:alkaline phosphatase D